MKYCAEVGRSGAVGCRADGEKVEMGSVLIHENVIAWCKGLVKP